jgi:hypothetical protein
MTYDKSPDPSLNRALRKGHASAPSRLALFEYVGHVQAGRGCVHRPSHVAQTWQEGSAGGGRGAGQLAESGAYRSSVRTLIAHAARTAGHLVVFAAPEGEHI